MIHPTRLGKYEIQVVLGKGAMGIVYKGYDPNIERVVAIKTVRKDLVEADIAAEFMSRFKNEARAAGRLHHPNIVGIYEYGEDDVVAFIAILATNIVDPANRQRFVAEPHATGTGFASARTGGQTGGSGGRTTPASHERSGATAPHTGSPPRTLDQAFVDETTKRLAVYLGPIARIITKKAAQQATSPEAFVQIVASHIGTQDRHAFLREIGFGKR